MTKEPNYAVFVNLAKSVLICINTGGKHTMPDRKVPYTSDGVGVKTRGSYMRIERRELNILVMKEKALKETWRKVESIFDKLVLNNTAERDQELLERFGELMKQFRKERDSYLETKARVEKAIEGQKRKEKMK